MADCTSHHKVKNFHLNLQPRFSSGMELFKPLANNLVLRSIFWNLGHCNRFWFKVKSKNLCLKGLILDANLEPNLKL